MITLYLKDLNTKSDMWAKNNDIFAKKSNDLGMSDTFKMKLETGDHFPMKNRPYRASLNKRQILVIDKENTKMMDAKITICITIAVIKTDMRRL